MEKYPKLTKKTPKELTLFITKLIEDSKLCSRKQDTRGIKGFWFDPAIINYMTNNKLIVEDDKFEQTNRLFE